MHLERDFAPAVRNADIALLLPAMVFFTETRAVAENRAGILFKGIRSLCETNEKEKKYSRIRVSGFLMVCSR